MRGILSFHQCGCSSSLASPAHLSHSLAFYLSLSLYLSLSKALLLFLSLLCTTFNDQGTSVNERRHALAEPTQTAAKWWTSTRWCPKRGSDGACTARDAPRQKWHSNADQRPFLKAVLGAIVFSTTSSSKWYPPLTTEVTELTARISVQNGKL